MASAIAAYRVTTPADGLTRVVARRWGGRIAGATPSAVICAMTGTRRGRASSVRPCHAASSPRSACTRSAQSIPGSASAILEGSILASKA